MNKLLRRCGSVLIWSITALLLISSFFIGLAGSESGTRWLLQRLPQIVGMQWSIASSRGNLLGELYLRELAVAHPQWRVRARELRLRWQPAALLAGEIRVEQIALSALQVDLSSAESVPPPVATEPAPGPLLPALPLRLRVNEFSIDEAVVRSGESSFTLDALAVRARVDEQRIQLEYLALRQDDVDLSGRGELALAAPHALALELSWRGTLEQTLRLSGQARIDGNLRDLALNIDQQSPAPVRAQGRLNLAASEPEIDLSADWNNLNWPLLGVPQWSSESGKLSLRGRLDDYRLALEGRVRGPQLDQLEVSLQADGNRQGLTIQTLPLRAGASRAEIQGRLQWAPELDAELSASWQDLRWPLSGTEAEAAGTEPLLRSPAGQLRVSGNPAAFQGRLDGRLSGPGFDDLQIRTKLQGDAQGLELQGSQLQLQTTSADADGRLQWSPQPRLELRGTWTEMRWPWQGQALFRSDQGRYQLSGWIDDYQFTTTDMGLSADWLPRVQADIQGQGDSRGLRLEQIRVARDTVRLDAGGSVDWSDNASWQFAGDWRQLRWPLDQAAIASSESGGFEVKGEGADYELVVDGKLLLPGLPELAVDANGRGDGAGLKVQAARVRHGQTTLRADGRLDWRQAFRFAAAGDWTRLQWPLAQTPMLRSPSGRFAVEGQPQRFSVQASGPVRGQDLPPAEIELEGFIDPAGLDLAPLRFNALEGRGQITGRVDWAGPIGWNLEFESEQLNPGLYWPDWPGDLALRGDTQGRADGGAVQSVALLLERAEGRLRGQDLAAKTRLGWQPQRLEIEQASLVVGANTLQMHGVYGPEPDLEASLNAPKLAELWPGLAGHLAGTLRWQDPLPRSQVQADFAGGELAYQGYSVDQLRVAIAQFPQRPQDSNLDLEALGVATPAMRLQNLNLSGEGLADSHRLRLRAEAIEGRLDSTLAGGWDGSAWRGELRSLDLALVESGDWQAPAPAGLEVGRTRARLEPICLYQQTATVCLDGLWRSGESGHAQLTLARVPLSAIDGWLSTKLRIDGTANGELNLDTDAQGPRAKLSIKADQGDITWIGATAEDATATPYRDANIEGVFVDDELSLELALAVADAGRGSGRLNVGAADAGGTRRLEGTIEVNLPDLAFVSRLMPDIENAQGRMALTSRLAGTLADPEIFADARLIDGAASLPRLGIQIEDVQLRARQQSPQTLALSGGMRSAEGRMTVDGTIDIARDSEWPLQLRVSGDRFEIADLIEAEVLISPDLQVRAGPGRLDLSGRLAVPKARFEIQGLQTAAVPVSSDEVIVGPAADDVSTIDTDRALQLSTDLELSLGENVNFTGFGLESGLSGDLRLRTQPGRSPTAQGSLDLSGGRYRAFGQNLQIERGQLIFVGPVENPTLDLRAVRKAGEITAGLAVSGPLRNPVTRVFSNPPMAESEALGYLLTGGPSARANQRDQVIVAQAALSYGLKQALPVTRQLEDAFDLDEITLSGNTDSDESALLIGKYLTPDLYVRYSYGLIERIGGLLLRYRLTNALALEASSGAADALDLIYTIDTD